MGHPPLIFRALDVSFKEGKFCVVGVLRITTLSWPHEDEGLLAAALETPLNGTYNHLR